MIEFEGGILLPVDTLSAQLVVSLAGSAEGAALGAGTTSGNGNGEDAVLRDTAHEVGDEWIGSLLSGASSEASAAGLPGPSEIALMGRESNEEDGEDIIITGKLPSSGRTVASDSDGSGATGGAGGTGGSTAATAPNPVEQHTQDCGTEDGAATQVAKHVMGELPAGVSGPEDPVTTSSGNDWRKVEFGAVIVKNPDGTFGALNNMIYSSNQPGYVALPDSTGQPVQGLWHSHIRRDTPEQQAIDRYPSPRDWDALGRIGGQAGAALDPSIWITGPDGITREFKLSERAYFEKLDDDPLKMEKGEGLEGRERTQSCG